MRHGRPLAGIPHFLEAAAERLPVVHLLGGEIGVAENDGQQVVEVMRDAPGQPPDGLHFLGLPELRVALFQVLERLGGAEHVTHPVDLDGPVERLGGELRGARLVGAMDGLHVVQAGDHEDRGVGPGDGGADPAARFEAVHLRHHDVHHDDLGPARLEKLDGLPPGFGLLHQEPRVLQRVAGQNERGFVVIDDQDKGFFPPW